MKKLIGLCGLLLLLIGCESIIKLTKDDVESITVEGVVVMVEPSSILISQKEDFSECDFLEGQNAYTESHQFYDLLAISNVTAQVGDIVSVEIKPDIAESYPAQAAGVKLEVISHLNQLETCLAPTTPSAEESFSHELLDVFPKTLQLHQQYNGYAEYGHVQTLKDIKNEKSKFFVMFEGEMMDGLGGEEQRRFDLIYEVTDNMVIERIENYDPYNKLNDKNLLNSIIPQKIILKLPLEVGTVWEEPFEFEGIEYLAKTSIVRAELNEAGNMEYETETIIENILGYFQDNYKERRIFEQGLGMIAFSNKLSKEQVGVDYPADEETEDLYLFGYSLSTEHVLK